MENRPVVVAVDFDGVIVEDAYPKIGKPNTEIIKTLKQLQLYGIKLILWTCRCNLPDRMYLSEAESFCLSQGLAFDAVNENLPELIELYGNDCRKVFADYYIDDRNISTLAELVGIQESIELAI